MKIGCYNITDTSMIKIAESCRDIETLNIAYCHNISDSIIVKLAECCPKMNDLNSRLS
jgi:hypothetical protein